MTEAVVASLDGEPLRASFPMRATVFGIDVVVIPAAEYSRLVDAGARPAGQARKVQRPPKPSRLDEQDPEVAAFVRDRLAEGLAIWRIEDAVRRAFGKDRTPTWGAIRKYRLKVLSASPAPPTG